MTDRRYMERAIELALKGTGAVNPNPLVGAVIVKDGRVIGEGYHERYGQPHAERNALASCSGSPEGADIYVTLEPCCHKGLQPPCTEAIIESGIKHVIVGSSDPNPLVAGKGVEILRAHGIEVTEDFMKEECDSINPVFFHYIRTKRPYVVMKYAMTADGKIATRDGLSKWITGEEARNRVQEDRNRYSAIMAGIGTVLADDPLLTCRLEGSRDPVRIICDTKLRIPLDSQIVETAKDVKTIIASASNDREKKDQLVRKGCEILSLPLKGDSVDLDALSEMIGEMKIDSILLEGGGTLNWSALEAGIVSRVQCYIAPKIFGGRDAPSPVRGMGVHSPAEAAILSKPDVTVLGEDILLESEVLGCSQE